MNVVLAAAGALALTITMAGCGNTPRPQLDPDLAGQPTWGGCREYSDGIFDFAPDARGPSTPRLAMASYRQEGDHVVVAPRHSHTNRQWLLVDDRFVIHTALELRHAEHGWLVTRVERCQD